MLWTNYQRCLTRRCLLPPKHTIFDLLKILVLQRFGFYEILLLPSNSDLCIIVKLKQEVKASL